MITRAEQPKKTLDYHILIFFTNAVLVVASYGLERAFGLGTTLKVFRTGIIVLSLISISPLLNSSSSNFQLVNRKNWIVLLFIFLNFLIIPFSDDFRHSLDRLIIFTSFLLYINYFIFYLYKKYDKTDIKYKILQVLRVIYCLPLVLFLISGNLFTTFSIYGNNEIETLGLKSRELGWASIIYIVTTLDLLWNLPQNSKKKTFYIITVILALYIVLISGARSCYLALVVTILLIFFKNAKIYLVHKIITILVTVVGVNYLLNVQDSILVSRLEKTRVQIDEGTERRLFFDTSLDIIKKYEKVFLVGVGFDNFNQGLKKYAGIETKFSSHNSYLQVLITSGVFIGGYFFIFFIFNALRNYFYYDSKDFIFLPALLIIPFFESNYGAGQYLFFPWMFFLVYYIHYNSLQIPAVKSQK